MAVTVLVAAACAGGPGLARAEVVARGDALCANANDDLEPLFGELFPTGSETPPAEVAAPVMTKAAKVIGAEADAFATLRSAEDDAVLAEIRNGIRRIADGVEASAVRARAGDTEGYLQALEDVNGLDAEVRERMKEYGFRTCAGEAP